MRFVKFVTSSAPTPRFDFHATFIPVVDSQASSSSQSGDFESEEGISFEGVIEEDSEEEQKQ